MSDLPPSRDRDDRPATPAAAPPSPRRIAVIGGGAAGLMAALFAGREGGVVGFPPVHTTLFEGTPDGGRKILISGGGRCNVLPGSYRPERFVTDSSPNLLRRLLRGWPLEEQRAFFEGDLGIRLKHEPEFDKLFPVSDRAREVRDTLVGAVRGAGVQLRFGTRVTGIRPDGEGGWQVGVGGEGSGPVERFDRVILATGGQSVPATGSDGAGLGWARALGHEVTEPYPALTPLLADPPVHRALAGVSLEVELRSTGPTPFRREGSFLFTHRGYSGPVVLDGSHIATRRGPGGGCEGARGARAPLGRALRRALAPRAARGLRARPDGSRRGPPHPAGAPDDGGGGAPPGSLPRPADP